MSQNNSPRSRRGPIGARLPGPAIVRVPVKRIGRDTKRCYCERCGQKRRACVCDAADVTGTIRSRAKGD